MEANLIDPRTLEHEYDPMIGNLGRGHRDIAPEQVNLSEYQPYIGTLGQRISIVGPDLKETGWDFYGWMREENGKYFIVGFEKPDPVA